MPPATSTSPSDVAPLTPWSKSGGRSEQLLEIREDNLLRTTRFAALGLAGLFGILAIVDSTIRPGEFSTRLVTFDLVAASTCVLVGLALNSGRAKESWAHPFGSLVISLGAGKTYLVMYLERSPTPTISACVAFVAIASIFLSSRWFFVTLALLVGGWFATALISIEQSVLHEYALVVTTWSLLSVIIFRSRKTLYRRIGALRHRDGLRKNELEKALEASRCEIRRREAVEAVLREGEQRLRLLDENASDMLWTADLEGRLTYVSQSVQTIRGFKPRELIGEPAEDRLTEKSLILSEGVRAPSAKENRRDPGGRPPESTLQLEMKCKDGSTVWTETTASLMRDADGNPIGYMGVSRDITERLRAEEVLRQQAMLMDQIHDSVIATDIEGKITSWNAASERMFGYTAEEAIGRDGVLFLYDEEEIEKLQRMADEVRATGEIVEGELRPRTKAGKPLVIILKISLFKNVDGEIQGLIGYSADVTQVHESEKEKTKLESQLWQAQKMEAIGTLAGGVAHDFNNLLTGILGYANMLKLNAEPGTPTYKGADVIERAAERGSQLTKQLLGFARKGKLKNVAVDINSTVEEVAALLQRTIDKSIRTIQGLCSDGAFVMGDPDQLQQVVLNLAVNARDSMPDGGEITFVTDIVELGEDYCRSHPEAVRGTYVLLSVRDTGVGIPRDIQDRIFEPFFTTKSEGKGTGMGLATSYGIVKNHSGYIQVYSEVGRGTEVKVFLPLHRATRVATGQADPDRIAQGSGCILLVDDEEIIRELGSDMLTELGYEVITAKDGKEAIQLFAEHRAQIDLAIIDMIMPVMGGRDCFLALKNIDPEVKTILSSGYTLDGAVQQILDEGMLGFVPKPYRLHELSHAVAQALNTPKDRSVS